MYHFITYRPAAVTNIVECGCPMSTGCTGRRYAASSDCSGVCPVVRWTHRFIMHRVLDLQQLAVWTRSFPLGRCAELHISRSSLSCIICSAFTGKCVTKSQQLR